MSAQHDRPRRGLGGRLRNPAARRSLLFLVAAAFTVGFRFGGPLEVCAGWAAGPEPMPGYVASTSLRQDATLTGMAFSGPVAHARSGASRNGETSANSESPANSEKPGKPLAASVERLGIGLAVGDHGTILRSSDGGASWRTVDSGVTCSLAAVAWISPRRAIAVGGGYDRITRLSRGVILVSGDAGRSWQRSVHDGLPRLRSIRVPATGRSIRVPAAGRAIHVSGDFGFLDAADRWVSHDAGRTWTAESDTSDSSPQNTPAEPSATPTYRHFQAWTRATGFHGAIRCSLRVGELAVFAAGDHGAILRSTDRGQSWQTVRGPGRSAAVMVVGESVSSFPWPVLGKESLELRHRSVGVILDSRPSPPEDGSRSAVDEARRDLIRQVGSATGAASVDVVAVNDNANDNNVDDNEANDVDSLRKSMDRVIAVHRPGVLVLDAAMRPSARDVVTRAAIDAGVERVIESRTGGRGGTTLHAAALLPRTGMVARDLWADALMWASPATRPGDSIALRTTYNAAVVQQRGESATSGLDVDVDAAHRLAADPAVSSRRRLQVAQARAKFRQHIADSIHRQKSAVAWDETLRRVAAQATPEDRLRLLWYAFQLAETTGRRDAVDVTLQRIADDSGVALSARHWAAAKRAAEAGSVERTRLPTMFAGDADVRTADATAEVVPVSPFQVDDGGVVQASATSLVRTPQRDRGPIHFRNPADMTGAMDLAWDFHPVALVVADLQRTRDVEDRLQSVGEVPADLQRLAQHRRSQWAGLLRDNSNRQLVAQRATRPPRLDGDLSEPLWTQGGHVVTADGMICCLAYDDRYVYVGLSGAANDCGPDSIVSTDSKLRDQLRRDQDLGDVDHVGIDFDIDRDLFTRMRLHTTRSGRTFDAVDANATWQPTWYVAPPAATGRSPGFEIAIARRDLVELPVLPGDQWFFRPRLSRAKPHGSAVSLHGDGGGNHGGGGDDVMPRPDCLYRVTFR